MKKLFVLFALVFLLTGCQHAKPDTGTLDGTNAAQTGTESQSFVLKEAARFDSDGKLLGTCAVAVNKNGLPVTISDSTEGEETRRDLEITYDEDGNLREVITTQYSDNIERYEFVFNEQGSWIKNALYTDGDEYLVEYEYNEQGKQTAMIMIDPHSGEDRWEMQYDENGKVAKRVYYMPVGKVEVTCFEYNEQGKEWKRTVFLDDQEQSVTECTYNENGDILTEITTEKGETECLIKSTYTYDENGKLLKYVKINNHIQEESTYYTYDEEGNLLEEAQSRWGHKYVTYKYDQSGNILTESRFSLDEVSVWTEYTYNDRGQQTEAAVHGKTGNETERTVFEYDKNGNLIKETVYINDTLKEYITYTWYENDRVITAKNAELIQNVSRIVYIPNILSKNE